MSGDWPGLYLFCAAPAGAPEPGASLAGYGGQPIEALPLPPVILWVQSLRHAPERSAGSVLTHHRVVAEAWRRTEALAPMRFGQWFREREALERALEPRLDTLARDLVRVRGAGEHVVRMESGDAPAPAERDDRAERDDPGERDESAGVGGRGWAHMAALAARERRRREREAHARSVAAELAERVGALAREERVEPLDADGLVSVAHLVARSDEQEYSRAVDAFVAERPDLRAVRGGPWPPYSFVS